MSYKNMNFARWLWHQVLGSKKVGDTVNFKTSQVTEWKGDGCPLCHEPSDAELASCLLTTFNEEELCQKHLTEMHS